MASEGAGGAKGLTSAQGDGEKEVQHPGPLIVRFPRQFPAVEPVKLEGEEAAEVGESKSRNMVQVYFMGAYLVGRWAWARYQERQSRRDLSGRKYRRKE